MKLSQARCLALRLSVAQSNAPVNRPAGKLVPKSAILLAGLGIGVSSFSLKQMFQSKRPKISYPYF
ncbi:unnamed protein product [Phyllotreta striolata]|uniref:Uncharacterized protein n=1 Tax=Phyllotreta striolata TaxID=444603 RepID=A0A9N9TTI7_PHYSR|nr:unnamed protein product [Phyllotreta striolata]